MTVKSVFTGLSKKFSFRDARYLTKISTGTNFLKSVLAKKYVNPKPL